MAQGIMQSIDKQMVNKTNVTLLKEMRVEKIGLEMDDSAMIRGLVHIKTASSSCELLAVFYVWVMNYRTTTSICFMKSCSRCAPVLCRISESTGFSCLKKSSSFFLAILVLANAACDNNLWAIS